MKAILHAPSSLSQPSLHATFLLPPPPPAAAIDGSLEATCVTMGWTRCCLMSCGRRGRAPRPVSSYTFWQWVSWPFHGRRTPPFPSCPWYRQIIKPGDEQTNMERVMITTPGGEPIPVPRSVTSRRPLPCHKGARSSRSHSWHFTGSLHSNRHLASPGKGGEAEEFTSNRGGEGEGGLRLLTERNRIPNTGRQTPCWLSQLTPLCQPTPTAHSLYPRLLCSPRVASSHAPGFWS